MLQIFAVSFLLPNAAFQQAFPPGGSERVQLVIKALQPPAANVEWIRLQEKAAEDPRLKVIKADLKRQELLALMGCCDVFLSLHRSEGFGRGIAEAGILSLEVVASAYGGNVDFCQGRPFYLVSCTPTLIKANTYPHAEGHIWGNADLEEATTCLKLATAATNNPPGPSMASPALSRLTKESCGKRYVDGLNRLLRAKL